MAETAKVVLKSVLDDLVPRSRLPLAFVYEAISNSLESISQRHELEQKWKEGFIEARFYFSGLFDDVNSLEKVQVIDSGIGFNQENYSRFETLLDKSKGYNNRGSGRLQFLHFAEKVEVKSVFSESGKLFQRTFKSDRANLASGNQVGPVGDETERKTEVSLIGISERTKSQFKDLTLKALANEVKNHFLLRLYLDSKRPNAIVPKMKLAFYKRDELVDSIEIQAKDIPPPVRTGTFNVGYERAKNKLTEEIEWIPVPKRKEVFSWAHFKLPESDLARNGIFLCSKNVPVLEIDRGLVKKAESVSGFRFLTVIYGEALDDAKYVNHSVDDFTFPRRKETTDSAKSNLFFDEKEEFLFFDSIEDEIRKVIAEAYSDLGDLRRDQAERIQSLAQAHGISEEIAGAANIKLSDSESQIVDKLYRKQAELNSKANQKIKRLYESLNELSPAEPDYQENLESRSSELLALIPQQNKEELGRY